METYSLQFFFAMIAMVVMLYAYLPYLKDLFAGRTKPHIYTWLIWGITASVATAGVFVGGGNWGVLPMFAGTLMVLLVFLLSFKYGTKNITRGDSLTLVLALLAIVIWIQLDSPLLAVLLVTAIDGFGYIPTFRKTFHEPWTETSSFWLLITLSYLLTMAASSEFNLLTMSYLSVIGCINIALYILIVSRRKILQQAN